MGVHAVIVVAINASVGVTVNVIIVAVQHFVGVTVRLPVPVNLPH